MKKPKVLVIIGPTAIGKTKLGIEMAKELNGEIISADSMQIYKYMDIGTAKPTKEEMEGIPHHLIDIIPPDQEFSVAKFKELAQNAIEDILSKDKFPIIVGGTGLYINTLLDEIQFSETICDWEYREELKRLAEEKGNQYLHDILEEVDPIASKRLHVNDIKRVIRALEVYKYTGKPISYHQEISKGDPKYDYKVIGLTMDRAKLYERVEKRIDIMIEQGLIDEIKSLVKRNYNKEHISMQGLGYKEIIDYLEGKFSLDEAIEILKRDTRHFAKRQLTWFRRDARIHWIDMQKNLSDVKKEILNYLEL